MARKLAIIATVTLLASSIYSKPVYFNQCDSDWKDDKMSNSQYTICQKGDMLTVIAMIANGCGIKAPDSSSITPATLNNWLNKYDGYKSDFSLDFGVLENLKIEKDSDSNNINKIKQKYKYGYFDIAV